MYDHDYGQTDIYIVDVNDAQIKRVTNTDYNESYPIWANTKDVIFYTADLNGVWNLFLDPTPESLYKGDDLDKLLSNGLGVWNEGENWIDSNSNGVWDWIDSNGNSIVDEGESEEWTDIVHTRSKAIGDPFPITNVLTGLQQPTISKDDKTLIFAGYAGIGWDLYSISQPLYLKRKEVLPTQFVNNKTKDTEKITDLRRHKSNKNLNNESEFIYGIRPEEVKIVRQSEKSIKARTSK